MVKIKKYFRNIVEILKFHDIQPLLLIWCTSDVLNNQVLWTDYSYWLDLGQPNTYYLYMVYLVCSIGMLAFLNNLVWLSRFISGYLLLTIFATIRYLVSLFTDDEAEFDSQTIRALVITLFYFIMWSWVWFKVKREVLYKKVFGK
tara:strand:- start:100 stop:534 length:435 start_codon:yes stop_codon:yes gene_type:complete